ncbi:MAG TPA: hypothetical protein VGW34_12315 [Allosphingosinicella sp.]|nr:hypothetical protein [Allosphingosinicella sp.]
MTTDIAVPGTCRNCGATDLLLAADHTENSWLDCSRCGRPTRTWGDYKKEALNMAADAIRHKRANTFR